jgi:hypothetical protein
MGAATSEREIKRTEPLSNVVESDETPKVTSEHIHTDIEATRAQMGETIDAIQSKLSPQNVQTITEQVTKQVKETALEVTEMAAERFKQTALEVSEQIKGDIHKATVGRIEKMIDDVKETTRGASSSLLETIKENPIPAALVGVGVAWLLMSKSTSRRRPEPRQYPPDYSFYPQGQQGQSPMNARAQAFASGVQAQANQMAESVNRTAESVRGKANQMAESVNNTAESVKGKANQMAESISSTAGSVRGKATEVADQAHVRLEEWGSQAHEVVGRSQSMLEEHPLIIGAIALALGAAIGLALPETRRENELMGETRDKLVRQANEAAQDTMHRVEHVAKEALHATQDAIKQEAQNQGLVGDRVGQGPPPATKPIA